MYAPDSSTAEPLNAVLSAKPTRTGMFADVPGLANRFPTDRPIAIIDIETTGVPNILRDTPWKGHEDFRPAITQIAASILMPDDTVTSKVSSYVWADEGCFLDWRAKKAVELTGINFQAVRDSPGPDRLALALHKWMLKNGCEDFLAFNDRFERHFLCRDPWNFQKYKWHDALAASVEILTPIGALPANPKFVGLNQVVAFIHGYTHGELKWKGLSHGAPEDVRMTVEVVKHLRKFQKEIP